MATLAAELPFIGAIFISEFRSIGKPIQQHHFATDKSTKYTEQFKGITAKHGLNLDEDWNKELLPRQGRHPNEYHEYILDRMVCIDRQTQGDPTEFLRLYEDLKADARANPGIMYKNYWR